MTKKSYLEQYAALSAEIIQIEHELCKLSSQPTHLATNCVMASPAHEPYQNIPTPISGHVQENSVSRERRKLMKNMMNGLPYCTNAVIMQKKSSWTLKMPERERLFGIGT